MKTYMLDGKSDPITLEIWDIDYDRIPWSKLDIVILVFDAVTPLH